MCIYFTYIKVDLKVHGGMFITKAAGVTTWDLAKVFSWVRESKRFFGERFDEIPCMDEVLHHIFFTGEARTFWIVNGRDTLDLKYLQWSGAPPASTIQGVDVLVDLQKIFRESVPRKQWRKRRCPSKPIAQAAAQHLCSVKGTCQAEILLFPGEIIPTWPSICLWLSPRSLAQLLFTFSLRASKQHKDGEP